MTDLNERINCSSEWSFAVILLSYTLYFKQTI